MMEKLQSSFHYQCTLQFFSELNGYRSEFEVTRMGDDLSLPSRFIGNWFIGSGGLGNVYGGIGPGGRKIAIKLVGMDDYQSLEHEWRMYSAVSKKDLDGLVVPRCFGLFKHENFAILVTEYAGVSVPEVVDLSEGDRCV
jgi:hypothetical protein